MRLSPSVLGDLPFVTARVVKRRKERHNLCKKVFGEEWHILGTIAEGVQRELKYLEPVVQIFAKFGLLDRFLVLPIGRGEEANVAVR